MSASTQSIFKKAKMRHLFEIKRCLRDVGQTVGFVVDVSDALILFHALDQDSFRLNGYTVIKVEDISCYRVFGKADNWQFRAAKHFRLKPVRPVGVCVASLPELLRSVAKHYPLITLHPERKEPDVCYIGPLVSMTERTFTIENLDCDGKWSGLWRMKFSDVTRVDFGGGYEKALAITAPKRPKTRR